MVHGTRRNAKEMRNLRCRSADSGVSCTLSNKLLQQDVVQSSKFEFSGLDEEHLDFEPEFGEELSHDVEEQSQLHSDESTVKLLYSDDREVDRFSNATVGDSISTMSISHRREMLPMPHSDAQDGRQNEYLPFTYCSTSSRTLLDSSSNDSEMDDSAHSSSDVSRNQVNNSDDLDHDVNEESSWDMSQEEEDKLLNSSEDESEEYEPFSETDLVETCQIGNARITLPKFINSSLQTDKFRGNDLKRTTSSARLTSKYSNKKKKKWDVRFKPDLPPTRVFLNDIGYVPICSSDDSSSSNDSDSVDSVPHIRVICNDMKKVVCQTSKGENQREKFSMPQNEDNVFKLPLPPPKRPPTRPKRTVCNNQDSGKNLQIQFTNKHAEFGQMQENSFVVSKSDFSDDSLEFLEKEESDKFNMTDKDDIISIIASTIEGDNNEEISDRSQVESDSICAVNLEPLRKNSMESIGNLSYAEKRIQNWVQNVPDPDPPLLIQEKAKPLQLTHNHIIKMPPTSSKGNPRIFFKDIPVQFSGLCYFHYFNGNCARPKHCNLMHTIMKDKYTHRFQKSSPEDLSKAYDFSLAFEKLFKEIYSCFLVAFGILKMQKKLVSSIEDIFRIGSIDTTEALEFIVKGLETSGLSFLESIEMISFNVGFLQFPELGDILLDLITRKHNISENWDVIKRIAKARGHVSPTIVTRMLTRVTAVYPLNKHLCLEIYNVIIENKMTDLSQINEEFLAPFRTLAGFRDLTDTTEKPTVSVPSSRSLVHPPVIPSTKEQLAAHIDNNLIKEREWYEREVEGRTIRMTTIPIRPPEPGVGNYVSSYNYKSRNVTNNYDNPNHSSDSDDRYFMPKPMQHTFAQADHGLHSSGFSSPFMGNHVFSGPESTVSNIGVEHSTFSPCSSLHFEPPPLVSKYVPETVRKNDARNEPVTLKNLPSTFEPPRNVSPYRHQDITLTPSRPIFGNFRCRSDFKLDRSLHNLLPDTIEHVSINERDIAKLDGVIKSKNGSEFCKLLERYRSPATIQNFITMMIAHLKSCNAMYEVLLGLVDSIESIKPDYDKDRHIKAVVEVVVMNLLFELERKGLWFKARKLLEKFCDWDSLISSQIFAKRKVTLMGRYIFLAKIFAKSQHLHFTYEILQCPSLHLLESCESWPLFFNSQVDVEQRNAVLTDFFKYGYRYSITDVSDMYRRIYKYGGIHGYDAHCLFNPMLISLMNEQQISLLKQFYPDIDIYYKVMDKNVLRAYTILLADQLGQEELYRLYELCCERQIYTYFKGGETNITVRNNMMDVELQLILSYYFYKITKTRHLPAGDVIINIRLLESQVRSPKILQKCCRSIKEINDRMKGILRDSFNIIITDNFNSKPTIIEINQEQIEDWLRGKDQYCHVYW